MPTSLRAARNPEPAVRRTFLPTADRLTRRFRQVKALPALPFVLLNRETDVWEERLGQVITELKALKPPSPSRRRGSERPGCRQPCQCHAAS